MDPTAEMASVPGGHPNIHEQHQFPGDLPTGLMELMAGGGAPPEGMPPGAGGPPPEGMPPEAPPEEAAMGGAESEVEAYSNILDQLSEVMQIETVSEQERATLLKAANLIQGLLAQNEKMHEQAGANPVIRKAMAGA